MQLSRTWQRRLERGKRGAFAVGKPLVLGLAAMAGLNLVWQFLFGTPPDVVTPSREVINKSAVVSAFAQDYVSVWLTASQSDAASLNQFVTVNPASLKLPSTPAVVINTPTVAAVTYAGLAGKDADVEVFSVVVGVTQRPYESASPRRALYRVPVLWSRYGPRAASLPARITGPGAGADLPLSYPTTLSESDPAYSVATGFLNAYLAGDGQVERYVTAESKLFGVPGAYQSITVSGVTAGSPPPTTPADGQTIRVLASVTAIDSQYAPVELSYPLTMTGVGGRWLVAAIDFAPAVSTDDGLVPVAVDTDWRSGETPN